MYDAMQQHDLTNQIGVSCLACRVSGLLSHLAPQLPNNIES